MKKLRETHATVVVVFVTDERPGGGEEKQGRGRAGPHEDRHAPDKQSADGGHPAKDRAQRAARAVADGHADPHRRPFTQ